MVLKRIIEHQYYNDNPILERTFFCALINGERVAVQSMMDGGVNVNTLYRFNGSVRSYLQWAVHFNQYDIAKILLEAGADANCVSEKETALSLACKQAKEKMLDILLRHGAEPDKTVPTLGETFFAYAWEKAGPDKEEIENYERIMRKLVLRGAKIEDELGLPEKNARTLMEALDDGDFGRFIRTEMALELEKQEKERPASFMEKLKRRFEKPALSAAFLNAVLSDDVENALKAYPRADDEALGGCVDRAGRSLLHRAAGLGYADMTAFLIKAGLDVQAVDKHGKTALDYALETGNEDVLAVLAQTGKVSLPQEKITALKKEKKDSGQKTASFFQKLQTKRHDKYKQMPLKELKAKLEDISFLAKIGKDKAMIIVAERLTHAERMRLRVSLFKENIGDKNDLTALDAFIRQHKSVSAQPKTPLITASEGRGRNG